MTDRNEHLDEGTIHAWLDGALSPDESVRAESHSNACADCAALVAEARGLVAASSRILASLDAVPSGVIPGSESGTDQLAALRARRQAATRVWWRDRRFVAAASLLLVAGVSSVVWQKTTNQSPVAADAMRAVDSGAPVAAAPTREQAPAEAKAEAQPPASAPAPSRVASRQADPTTTAKVAAAGPVSGAVAEVSAESRAAGGAGQQRDVANAARAREATVGAAVASSQPESTKALARGDQSAFERKVQQQVQTPPTPPRIIPEQQQQGAANAPPPRSLAPRVADSTGVTSGAGAATRMSVTAASISAGARILDPDSPAGGCYALGASPPDHNDRLPAAADTVVLLDMPFPERSDPAWLVARPARGSASVVMRWRQVDSITVELRTRTARDSSAVRFQTRNGIASQSGGQVVAIVLPDVRGVPGVRAMWAMKVRCP